MLFKVEGLNESYEEGEKFVPIDPMDNNAPAAMSPAFGDSGSSLRPVRDEPNTAGTTIAWVLSLLTGVAVVLGVLFLVL